MKVSTSEVCDFPIVSSLSNKQYVNVYSTSLLYPFLIFGYVRLIVRLTFHHVEFKLFTEKSHQKIFSF